ncbi:hypothetical protein C8J56DRAFT_965170 [Mycena floridula]|nr:hypothetical protein C8J56DRAFT_965170 [Mycena floridula]
MANRHPNLATIQIRDSQLKLLSWFPSANPSLFSKILVDSVSLDGLTCRPLMPSSRRFLSDSGMRVRRLKLFGSEISNHGFDSLSFQGLEILEVPMRVASLSWLSSFVQSQPDLKKIHFDTPAGCRPWCSNSYIPGGAEIHNCFNLEGLESAVALNAMSICRTPTSTSLDDWDVTELQLRLQSNTLDVLKLTNTFYPRTSTLVLDFHEPTDRNIHMDDLITSLSRFPLVNVKFVSARRHLHFGQEAPWATDLPASQPDARISKRLEVNAALHWFFLRLVHKISSIEILEVQEGGQEWYLGTWGRRLGNWSIDATYRVDANSLKVVGTPRLVPFDK